MTEAGNIPLVRDTPAKSLDRQQLAEGGSEKDVYITIWTDQIPAVCLVVFTPH